MRTFHSVFFVLSCLWFALASAEETTYNKGVNAWRAKDFAEARKLWAQALAEGGADEAFNNLGYLLYFGLGGDSQPDKAVELWRKGAALSVSEAQWHLGLAYEEGKGVARNLANAYAWYRCAIATAGLRSKIEPVELEIKQSAADSLAKLMPKLSRSERTRANRLADNLIARYAARLSL